MRYVFGQQDQSSLQLAEDEVSVLFVDFTGTQQLVILNKDEQLKNLPIMQGTSPVVAL